MLLKRFNPSYLTRATHGYVWRLRVPKVLQPIIKRKELRYSLKTYSLKKARERSGIITGQTLRLFKAIKRDIITMGYTELTEDKIKSIIQEYVKDTVADINDYRLSQPTPLNEKQLDEEDHAAWFCYSDACEALGRLDIESVSKSVDALLHEHDVSLSHDDPAYKRLAMEILKANRAVQEYYYRSVKRGHHKGEPEDVLKPFLVADNQSSPSQQPEETSATLSTVIQSWWAEASPSWKERTEVEYKRGVERFNAFL